MYDLYKPLRNYLRQYEWGNGLMAVYHFVQYLQFDTPLPRALRCQELTWKKPYELGVFEWEMLTLAREIILNCDAQGRSMLSWSAVAGAINHIKKIENDGWRQNSAGDDIHFEMVRIANRQFDWQVGLNTALVSRFFMIIDDPRVASQVIDEFGMTPTELYQITLSLAGHFLENPSIRLPLYNQINTVAAEPLARLIDRLSLTFLEHRERTREQQSYDLNWAYNPSSLVEFPLVRQPSMAFCPVPALFVERMTKGIYFDLVRRGADFANSYGFAFEDYVGRMIRSINRESRFQIEGARKYGTSNARKDTVDWIISDTGAVLFVECKSSRVKLNGKIDLANRLPMLGELQKLANFIGQTYQTLSHAMNGQYGFWAPDERPVYPMVLTLDNWQRFGFLINDTLPQYVREDLQRRGLDPAMVERHPYTVCEIAEFEQAIQVMNQCGIAPVMAQKCTGEYQNWDMVTVLSHFFRDALRVVRPPFDWTFVPVN
jgi:hypothetical protein